ncbi:MAG: hypothetical protein JWO57_1455 [Pseudonocardiales bacterium]|nr:hypothetical protein [Pseudonocardiales bacterium]
MTMSVTKGCRVFTAALVALAVVSTAVAADAQAQDAPLIRVVDTFSDPFSGAFDCHGFSAVYAGHDHGTISTWYTASGDPVRQQGKISATETDTNTSSGASVIVKTQLNVHVDYASDIQTITGIRNLSTVPGRGVVIQSVGRLEVTASAGQFISVHGPADDVNLGGGFCEALAG